MRKVKLMVLVLVAISANLPAQLNKQSFGVILGVGYSTYVGEQSQWIIDVSAPPAYAFGMSYQYNVASSFSIQVNALYTRVQTNSELNYYWGGPELVEYNYQVDIQYFTVPILAKYYFAKRTFYGFVGPQLNFVLKRTDFQDLEWPYEGPPPEGSCFRGPVTSDIAVDPKMNFAALAGLGYSRQLTNQIGLEVECRGTIDFSKTEMSICAADAYFGHAVNIFLLATVSYGF
jgi:hypothetical protein